MIVSEYIPIDGKSYVTAEQYNTVLYKYKAAQDKICALEKQLESKVDESTVHDLLCKIEWYKGQIEAYQYCMNCRR